MKSLLTSRAGMLRNVVVVAVILVLIVSAIQVFSGGSKRGVAYFESVTSVYEGDKVRILGIEVGKIEKITPEGERVKVEFSYDDSYDLPKDVQAAIVSPTLVATRFVQLSPVYSGGPKLADGGEIPVERTASPLEFDDLKTELSRLSTALGPAADGSEGSLARFLNVSAEAGAGQGAKFNTMVKNLSDALGTLADGRGDIFGTVRNLEVFISAVAEMDTQVVDINTRLADVSSLLDDNAEDLTLAIRTVDEAARALDTFLAENRPALNDTMTQLGDVTGFLADARDSIAQLLHIAPNTVLNFHNIYDWKTGSWTGGLQLDNAAYPGDVACALIANQMAQADDQQSAQAGCETILGPLLNALSLPGSPVGVTSPIQGGGVSSVGRGPAESRPDSSGQNLIPSAGGN